MTRRTDDCGELIVWTTLKPAALKVDSSPV
jgi:hypothetical protein